MHTERRWMKRMIEEAATLEIVLPWERGARRARRPGPMKKQPLARLPAAKTLPAKPLRLTAT